MSGVFRGEGDFAVLVFFQKGDPFGHPRFSYLPDGNFTGIKLEFDIQWQGMQAFESKKSPWTDWAYLDCLLGNGQRVQKLLSQIASGPSDRTGASGTFTLNSGTIAAGDRVTLCYQNRAFDYTVPAFPLSCVQAMWWQGNAPYTHSVTIGSHTYGAQEGSLNSTQIATAVANLINASNPNCSATIGGTYNNEITITLKAGVTGPVAVSSRRVQFRWLRVGHVDQCHTSDGLPEYRRADQRHRLGGQRPGGPLFGGHREPGHPHRRARLDGNMVTRRPGSRARDVAHRKLVARTLSRVSFECYFKAWITRWWERWARGQISGTVSNG